MSTATLDATAETEIRELVETFVRAVRAGDIDGIMAHYAPDVRAFDAIGPLRFEGVDAYRKHWQACLEMCPGPMIFETHDLRIEAGDDVAFCHWLNRCGTISDDGEEKAGWVRATVGLRRAGGRWRVVHEHWSAPFEPESGKALLDLRP